MENRRIYSAPMLDLTDRHCRAMFRSMSRRLFLYTEMINEHEIDARLREGRLEGLLPEDWEHPIAMQIGGSHKEMIEQSARFASDAGYDEFNLNLGCPSKKVQQGRFGAILMKDLNYVQHLVENIKSISRIPFSIKMRIGIDELNSYEFFENFVEKLSPMVDRFIIHCRVALSNLDTKKNRSIPPIKYQYAYDLAAKYPDLDITLNGEVKHLDDIQAHIDRVNGVMVGRALYYQPLDFLGLDRLFGEEVRVVSEVLEELFCYCERETKRKNLTSITRHWMGLIKGTSSAKKLRNALATERSLDELYKIFSEVLR